MDNYSSLEYCKEGGRSSGKMLSQIRHKSYRIGKSRCKSSKEKKNWSQVSSSSGSSGMIRVIHIFSPKIIKTDPANFRELVQRLTGNTKWSRSGNKSERSGKSITSSPPRTQHILSEHSNATNIIASSSRVEYSIPRSSSIVNFHKQEEDIKPHVQRQSSCINYSGSSSDQGRYSVLFPFAEVTSSNFHGHQSQELNSINGGCNDGIPDSNLRSTMNQQQQQQQYQHLQFKKVQTSTSIMVDPFQSLSGYREKLPPTPQRSAASGFPLYDESSHPMSTSRFSDMDTLTGLVTARPLCGIPVASSPHINYSSDFNFQSCSLSSNPNGLCRFSVQSPLRGGIQQMFQNF